MKSTRFARMTSYSNVPPGNSSDSSILLDRIVPFLSHHTSTVHDAIVNLTTDKLPNGDKEDEKTHILAYVLVPLGSLVFIALLSFIVVVILRKSKLDKLRHHLMPLYNFDPAEEGADWESELLEEDKDQQVTMRLTGPSPTGGPKLKFTADSMDV